METVGKLLCVLRFGADQKSCESSAEFAPLFFLLFLAFLFLLLRHATRLLLRIKCDKGATPWYDWSYAWRGLVGVIMLFVTWLLARAFMEASGLGVWLAATWVAKHVNWLVACLVVFGLGAAAGTAELVSRYRDDPVRAISSGPAIFYVGINALGSLVALHLLAVFGDEATFPKLSTLEPGTGTLVKAALLAGFSALLFFRTSLFKLHVGDSDLSIGPAIVLDTLLTAADRAVDRILAAPRAKAVRDIMKGISFERAAIALPAHCFVLMQNVSSDETQKINGLVRELRTMTQMPDSVKAQNLGLALLNIVGELVLKAAVDGLREEIADSTSDVLKQVSTLMASVAYDKAYKILPPYCFSLWPFPVSDEQQAAVASDLEKIAKIADVPKEYKSLILGIKLAKLTDGATLTRAIGDLSGSIMAAEPH